MSEDRDVVSAQVVLWPADRSVDVDQPISSETLHRHLPDPGEAHAARRAFVERGFAVGPLVGIGFSITASPEVFRGTFGHSADAPLRAAHDAEREPVGFDASGLSADLAHAVRAVELTPPPDFGPGAP